MTQTELVTKRFEGKTAVITGGNSGIPGGAYTLITCNFGEYHITQNLQQQQIDLSKRMSLTLKGRFNY